MKIDVCLDYDPREAMRRIHNVITVCGTVPKAVIAWMSYARPQAVTDADLQKVFGIVDAAMSVMKDNRAAGYDFDAAVKRVDKICRARLGEMN